jgi:hypothetical protein
VYEITSGKGRIMLVCLHVRVQFNCVVLCARFDASDVVPTKLCRQMHVSARDGQFETKYILKNTGLHYKDFILYAVVSYK